MNIEKNKKPILLLVLVLVLITGCSSPESNKEAIEFKDGYPIEVEDYLGRKVIIEKPLEKIACGHAFVGHAMALVERGDDITAVVGGLQGDKILNQLYPQIKDLPAPFSSGNVNVEELLKNKPDMVFVKPNFTNNVEEVEKLEAFDIPFITIDFTNIEEQIESLDLIGRVLDEEEKMNSYIDYFKELVEYVDKRVIDIPEDKRLRVYHSVNEVVRTSSKDTLPVYWIRRVGLINVSEDRDLKKIDHNTYATLEQIYLWDPDVIMLNEPSVRDYLMTDDQWAGLRAVKEAKVYQMPIGLSRWGHHGSLETPLGMLWASKTFYPDFYPDLNLEDVTRNFYKDFFGMDLNHEDIEDIFSGHGMRVTKK